MDHHIQQNRQSETNCPSQLCLFLLSSFAIMMCFFKHHIFYLHQTNLGTSFVLIQLHRDILNRLLCLRNCHVFQCIYTASCFFNLSRHQLTRFFRLRKLQHIRQYLEEESKVFVRGRVSEEDDAPSKLICETVIPFEQTRKEIWLQYADKDTFRKEEQMLYDMIRSSDGEDQVVIFCKAERAVKRLPANRNVRADAGLLSRLTNYLGESCVKVLEKPIENIR